MELRTIGSLCIEVPGNPVVDGQVVRTAFCNGTEAQRWDVLPGGVFRHGGACLTAVGTGGPLQLKTCSASAAQRFFYRSGGSIHFEDVCFDIEAGLPEPERTLQLYPCKPDDAAWRANQTFFLRGPLRSQGRCLEMPVDLRSQPAKLAPCNGGPLQVWDVHLTRTALQ